MPSPETLAAIEKYLARAITLNVRYAAAYAWLGEVRAYLGTVNSIGLIRRAISLEPAEAGHYLRAASVLLRAGKAAEALTDAQTALALADSDDERRRAQELLEAIAKAKGKTP
jgi:tetratricopeptide (TPR) repeat protein